MPPLIVPGFGAIAAIGLALMARGARCEAAGRLDDARWIGRRGGFLAALGSALLAMGSALPVAAPALACGAVALLGGLSGKPRPAVWFASAFLLGSFGAALWLR